MKSALGQNMLKQQYIKGKEKMRKTARELRHITPKQEPRRRTGNISTAMMGGRRPQNGGGDDFPLPFPHSAKQTCRKGG